MSSNEESIAVTASRLLDLSVVASDAESVADIAALLTEVAAPLVGAANAAVATVKADEPYIRVFQGPTATIGNASIRVVERAEPTPLTDAIRLRREIIVPNAEVFARDYPKIARRTQPGEVTMMTAYPLELNGEMLGACFYRFADNTIVSEQHLRTMERIAPLLARALARIQDRAALLEYQSRLERSNRDLENFAAVTAHDLSAPVRRIGSFLQLLEQEVELKTDTAVRYMGTIHKQVRHLDALLRDTLAYSQISAPAEPTVPQDLAEIVRDVLVPMRSDLANANCSVDVSDLPVLLVEPSLMRQVFQNLIDNAIKYRREDRHPSVRIDAERATPSSDGTLDWHRITVSDNGIGIDPSRSEEVFAMFARLEISQDRPGTGVGLAFVKRVVERHGGHVGLSPGIDGGTTVWFTLPAATSADVL